MSSLFLSGLIEFFLGFGGPLGHILPWDSRGDASPSTPGDIAGVLSQKRLTA